MGQFRDIILRDGYTAIPEFFNSEEVARLRELNTQKPVARGHHNLHGWQDQEIPTDKSGYQHYWTQPVHAETRWAQDRLSPFIADMMQDNYQWEYADFHVANPDSAYIHAHIDSPYQFRPWHEITELLAVQCLIAVDDFTEMNGGTAILPGSHREQFALSEIGSDALNMRLTDDGYRFIAPAGSVLMYHPRTLHSTMPNFSDLPRTALLILAIRPDLSEPLSVYHT